MQEPLIPGGYILISRKIIESEIWSKPPLYIKVWIYLLSIAQYKDYKGLKRGQLSTSIPEIIEACKWYVGARVERPSKDQIYRILEWLRKPIEGAHENNMKATMITTTKATHGLLISIDNYSVYQNPKNYEGNEESNNESDTKVERGQQRANNTNKESKEREEGEEIKNKKPPRPKLVYDEDDIRYQLANRLYQRILKNNPKAKKPNLQKWADKIRLMIQEDKRTEEDIRIIIDWSQGHSFWWSNVLSTEKLRKQFDTLYAQYLKELKRRGGNTNEISQTDAEFFEKYKHKLNF